MANSSLATYRKISSKSNPRTGKITKITIHHMSGKMTGKQCADYFASTDREVSANYCVGYDGDIAVSVDEERRAWTSSSRENDYAAVTIEVSNDGGAPDWHVSDKALAATIKLCADICKRNGIKKLYYDGTTSATLTRHCMFANTDCPGLYLKSKTTYICDEVNKLINASSTTTKPSTSTSTATNKTLYRVQVGAYSVKKNAENMRDKLKAAGFTAIIVEGK